VHDSRPPSSVHPEEITTRYTTARHIVAGFSAQFPALTEFWDHLTATLDDIPALTAELSATRLDRANLLAAMRAAIAAHADTEPDPLSYLRDELDARHPPSPGAGRAS
jgi:hypothetical protein